MGRIWITGFEPFGAMATNPSQSVVHALEERAIPGVATAVLPVEGAKVRNALEFIWSQRPDAVVHLGLAVSSTVYRTEGRAKNRLEYPRPDNGGEQLKGRVEPDGPDDILTQLDHEEILTRWRTRGIHGELSADAGSFLCNQALYLTLRALPDTPVGFIHLPPDTDLDPVGGRPLAEQLEAVQVIIDLLAEGGMGRTRMPAS